MKGLIVVKGKYNPTKGGPTGYVSKLKLGLDDISDFDFLFLYVNHNKNIKNLVKKHIPSFCLREIKKIKKKIFLQSNPLLIEFSAKEINMIGKMFSSNKYDFVHCHRAEEMLMMENFLNKRNIKVKKILTLHNPVKPSEENYSSIYETYGEKVALLWKKFFSSVENKAIECADFFIFPCEEAISSYYKDWSHFKNTVNYNKIKYILTGTQPQTFKENAANYRRRLNIPLNAFVFCFIGRHIEVKGYDILKEAAEKLLMKYDNLYFLIGGVEFPIKGLNHPRWIEIGWTNDAGTLMNAGDVFVLPNRETYFDLVLLEAMSLGIYILASNTGGNKKVAQNSDGITLFSPTNINLTSLIEKTLCLEKNEIIRLGQINKNAYQKIFNLKEFASKYINLYNSINNNETS